MTNLTGVVLFGAGAFVGFAAGWFSLMMFLVHHWRRDGERELRALRRDIRNGVYPD